jgi:hypothetical protein
VRKWLLGDLLVVGFSDGYVTVKVAKKLAVEDELMVARSKTIKKTTTSPVFDEVLGKIRRFRR